MGDIRRLFNPQTAALVGATEEEGKAGRTILENLLLTKNRKIFAVNPNRKVVMGLECYSTITDVPEKVDLSVVATPPQTVPEVVEECGKAGVEGIIIISSGFKEMGEEGRKLEEQIIQIKRTHGMRIIGPDCLGVIRPNIDLNASLSYLQAIPCPEPSANSKVSTTTRLPCLL
ncbi:MAG: CoA-binding protein [Candidatus Methanoperedens sp.]|nr:CoA-binding protein [Candidatus Methanoperedens sp.]